MGLATVVERASGFGKGDATDPRTAGQSAGLALDVHNASGLRLRLFAGRRADAAASNRLLGHLDSNWRLSGNKVCLFRFWDLQVFIPSTPRPGSPVSMSSTFF